MNADINHLVEPGDMETGLGAEIVNGDGRCHWFGAFAVGACGMRRRCGGAPNVPIVPIVPTELELIMPMDR